MRLPRPLVAVVLIAALSLLAACGSDSPSPSPSPSPSSSSPSGAAGTTPTSGAAGKSVETESTTAPVTSASNGPQQCAQRGDITIRIVLGSLACESAYDVAGRVDRQGEKRQTISGYVCEFGNAMTRPTIFTCTNRGKGTEFAVDET